MSTSAWQKIHDGVFMFQDSCRVYAVQCPQGTVLINVGTGLAADHLGEVVQNGPVTVLLTHHFRDHTDGSTYPSF
jgi:glyoxylase-like metal-dependent hydrolase (beta-lactamase superfamily II)